MARCRRTVRSSYSARSISPGDDPAIRARACRNTLGESDACSATTDAAASATDTACVPAASRCRTPTRARRSSSVMWGRAVTG
jgi:hypothetical protein